MTGPAQPTRRLQVRGELKVDGFSDAPVGGNTIYSISNVGIVADDLADPVLGYGAPSLLP